MPPRQFSGDDIIQVLVNVGPFHTDRVNGSHAVLKCYPPEHHNTDPRTVIVPRHDTVRAGTLQEIADQAGAQDFGDFCAWIDRNS